MTSVLHQACLDAFQDIVAAKARLLQQKVVVENLMRQGMEVSDLIVQFGECRQNINAMEKRLHALLGEVQGEKGGV